MAEELELYGEDLHINITLVGDAEYQEAEMDYFNGTGTPAGWDCYVNELVLELNGTEYKLTSDQLSKDLIEHLSEVATEYYDNHKS